VKITERIQADPEVCSASAYSRTFNPEDAGEVEERFRRGEIGCVACKRGLTQLLVEKLLPFRQVRDQWKCCIPELWDILRQGTRRARPIAQATVAEVRSKMGLPSLVKIGQLE
jgi:tryptophanyl-tRNA synthetase